MLQVLGILSGIVWIAGCFPYVQDIFAGKTKPERASWFIWFALGAISFFTQQAEGATWSLWFTLFITFGDFLIFVLSIKYGQGGVRKRDIAALASAAIGLALWHVTRHAYIALYISIFIDLIGYSLVFMKAYVQPKSETLSSWFLFSVSGILAALSVGKLNFVLLAFPLYIFMANLAVVIVILLGRSKKLKQ